MIFDLSHLHRPIALLLSSLIAYLFQIIVAPLMGEIFREGYRLGYRILFGIPHWTRLDGWIYAKGLASSTEAGVQFANKYLNIIFDSVLAVLLHFPIDALIQKMMGQRKNTETNVVTSAEITHSSLPKEDTSYAIVFTHNSERSFTPQRDSITDEQNLETSSDPMQSNPSSKKRKLI